MPCGNLFIILSVFSGFNVKQEGHIWESNNNSFTVCPFAMPLFGDYRLIEHDKGVTEIVTPRANYRTGQRKACYNASWPNGIAFLACYKSLSLIAEGHHREFSSSLQVVSFCRAMISTWQNDSFCHVITGAFWGSYCRMKHEESTNDSTERRKNAGGFFGAWNLHELNNDSLASLGQREPFSWLCGKGGTAFKGIYKLIEGGLLIHWPITPWKVFEWF